MLIIRLPINTIVTDLPEYHQCFILQNLQLQNSYAFELMSFPGRRVSYQVAGLPVLEEAVFEKGRVGR